jgi:N-acetylmuramoyl-L-alanine amidase
VDKKLRKLLDRPVILASVAVVALMLAMPLAASQIDAPAGQQGRVTGMITTGKLNVRIGPTTCHPVLETVSEGDFVELLRRNVDSSWVEVRTSTGTVGWVGSAHVQIVYGETYSELPIADMVFEPWAVVTAGTLNVRTGPGMYYPIVTVVHQNEYVALLGRNHDASWVYIRTQANVGGWVSSAYILGSVDLMTLTSVPAEGPGAVPPGEQPPGAQPPSGVPVPSGTAYVVTGQVNLYVTPSIESGVLVIVGQGTHVTLLGRNSAGTWVYVSLPNGMLGWIGVVFIEADVEIMSLPVVPDDIAAPAPPPAPAPTGTAYVTAGQANLYSGPSIDSAVITLLGEGTHVTLLGRNAAGTWVYVSLPSGTVGWLGVMFIEADIDIMTLPIMDGMGGGGDPQEPASDGSTAFTPGTAVVTAGALNVRVGPGSYYPIITMVYEGDYVTVIGRTATGSWFKVRLSDGIEGWLSSAYVIMVVPPVDLPILAY